MDLNFLQRPLSDAPQPRGAVPPATAPAPAAHTTPAASAPPPPAASDAPGHLPDDEGFILDLNLDLDRIHQLPAAANAPPRFGRGLPAVQPSGTVFGTDNGWWSDHGELFEMAKLVAEMDSHFSMTTMDRAQPGYVQVLVLPPREGLSPDVAERMDRAAARLTQAGTGAFAVDTTWIRGCHTVHELGRVLSASTPLAAPPAAVAPHAAPAPPFDPSFAALLEFSVPAVNFPIASGLHGNEAVGDPTCPLANVAAPPAAVSQAPPHQTEDQLLLENLGAGHLTWIGQDPQEAAGPSTTGQTTSLLASGVYYASATAPARPLPEMPACLPAAGLPTIGGVAVLAGGVEIPAAPEPIPFHPAAAAHPGEGAPPTRPERMDLGTVPSETYVSLKRDLDEVSDVESEDPRPTRKSKARRTSSLTATRLLMDVFKEAIRDSYREGLSRAEFCRWFQAQDITRWSENNRDELCRFSKVWASRNHNVMRATLDKEKSTQYKPVVDEMFRAAEQEVPAGSSDQNAAAGPFQPARSKRGPHKLRPPPMARSMSAPGAEAPAYARPLSGTRLALSHRAGKGSTSVPVTPRLAARAALRCLPSPSTPVHPSELEGRLEVVLKNGVRVFLPRGATQADLSPDDWVAVGAVAEGVATIRDESLRMLKVVDLVALGEPPKASTLSEPTLAPPQPWTPHLDGQERATAELQQLYWAQQQAQLPAAGSSQGQVLPQARLPGHPYPQAQLQALGHGQPPAQPWQAAPDHRPAAMPFGQVPHAVGPVEGGQTPGLVASPYLGRVATPEIRTQEGVLLHAAVHAPGLPQQMWQPEAGYPAPMGASPAYMPPDMAAPAFADQRGHAVGAPGTGMGMGVGAPVSAERHIPRAGPSQGYGGYPSAQQTLPQEGYGYPQ